MRCPINVIEAVYQSKWNYQSRYRLTFDTVRAATVSTIWLKSVVYVANRGMKTVKLRSVVNFWKNIYTSTDRSRDLYRLICCRINILLILPNIVEMNAADIIHGCIVFNDMENFMWLYQTCGFDMLSVDEISDAFYQGCDCARYTMVNIIGTTCGTRIKESAVCRAIRCGITYEDVVLTKFLYEMYGNREDVISPLERGSEMHRWYVNTIGQ